MVLTAGLLLAFAAQETSSAAWKERGITLTAAGNTAAGADAFRKACELDEKDVEACYYLGRALFTLTRYEEARAPFEKALRAAPREMQAKIHRAMAMNFIGLGMPAEAETHFREAVRLYSDGDHAAEDPRINYGAFLVRQGRAGDALRLLEVAVRSHPDAPRAHAELGKALLYTGNALKAVASLEKAVALDPKDWAARLVLGRAYLQIGRNADAERELRLGRTGWQNQNGGSERSQ